MSQNPFFCFTIALIAFLTQARPLLADATAERAKAKLHRGLNYAQTGNPRQALDLFLPARRSNDPPQPVIVYLHGGGWRRGDKSQVSPRLKRLTTASGYAVAIANYRLSGEAIWPAQIHDGKAILRWLRANASTYHLDMERCVVMGRRPVATSQRCLQRLRTTLDGRALSDPTRRNRRQSRALS